MILCFVRSKTDHPNCLAALIMDIRKLFFLVGLLELLEFGSAYHLRRLLSMDIKGVL